MVFIKSIPPTHYILGDKVAVVIFGAISTCICGTRLDDFNKHHQCRKGAWMFLGVTVRKLKLVG